MSDDSLAFVRRNGDGVVLLSRLLWFRQLACVCCDGGSTCLGRVGTTPTWGMLCSQQLLIYVWIRVSLGTYSGMPFFSHILSMLCFL